MTTVSRPVWLHHDGVAAALTDVEAALRAAVADPDPFLSEVATHLVSYGGKRLRPALALLAAAPEPLDAMALDAAVTV